MTEQEWLACTDPQKMLELLRSQASVWKLRLFLCACSSIWPYGDVKEKNSSHD